MKSLKMKCNQNVDENVENKNVITMLIKHIEKHEV